MHSASPGMAKVLRKLRMHGEEWALIVLKKDKQKEFVKPVAEKSLRFKTRLGLTRRKYESVRKYTKSIYGGNCLVPWEEAMQYRDSIIPAYDPPVWENGVLISRVALKEMVVNIIERLLSIEKVQEAATMTNGDLDCVLFLLAGVDSATGFSLYSQKGILTKDNSLLTECVLPLALETKSGKKTMDQPQPTIRQILPGHVYELAKRN